MQVGQPRPSRTTGRDEESPNSTEQGAPLRAGVPQPQGRGNGKCHRKYTAPEQSRHLLEGESKGKVEKAR